MSVHYKFKAALDFSTVTFDGIHISVSDLKEAIIDQKKLGKNTDFDLQIMNAQTNEVYEDASALIPKNTSVTVARVPITEKRKTGGTNSGFGGFQNRSHHRTYPPPNQPTGVAKGVDLTSIDATEEEKIQAMMTQSTADYDPSTYVRMRHHNQQGRVPQNYKCYKCNQPGHWIKDCPHNNEVHVDVKKSTGIPRSFMVAVDGPKVPGALITPEGRYAVPAVDHAAYLEKNRPKLQMEAPGPKPKIPEELLCNICQDLLTDALLVPCCAVSYCDDCIRSALLESDEQECPGCHDKGISPNTLIPSRFLRTAVNAFKNETGYSKPAKAVEPVAPITVDLTDSVRQRSPRRLSLDELPDDLFPHSPRKVEHDVVQSSKKEEPVDLYDFGDGSIPPMVTEPATTVAKGDTNQVIRTIGTGTAPKQIPRDVPQQYDRSMYRHPRMPFQGGLPPHRQHPPMHFQSQPPSEREPPPPGFEVLPPGEEKSAGFRPGPESNGGPQTNNSGMRHPMQNLPFDPNQPPPGFPGMPPPGMGQFLGPPPGAGYPFPPHFRGPPPGQMYPGPPPPGGDRYYRGERRRPLVLSSRSRERERSDRERDRDRPPRERERREDRRGDSSRTTIDDPLEEFNRLMREKDRRKQTASGPVAKRSRSPSFSPSRRTPSPFLKARSRSRTYSRSPSPKRKRLVLRRSSFSRSRSRSPLPPRRAVARVRSPSPLRRSPRRAPPCSPSPPPPTSVRNPERKYEKDDYYDRDSRSRYDPPRYASKSNPRDRDIRETDTRYDGGKYDSGKKYSKYESTSSTSKYESSKYDKHERQPSSRYHPADIHHSDREVHSRDTDRDRETQKHGFDSVAPGAEQLPLFEIQMKPPSTHVKTSIDEKSHKSSSYSHTAQPGVLTTTTAAADQKRESKDRSTHSHHHGKKPAASESKREDSKSPKKVKKEKKKHKKKSRDEKEEKVKKKKVKAGSKTDDTEEDHSITSGTQIDSVATQSTEIALPNQLNDKTTARAVACDSTVKSPVVEPPKTSNSVIKELVFDPLYKPAIEEKRKEDQIPISNSIELSYPVLIATATAVVPEVLSSIELNIKVQSPQMAIPPSKWDKDDEIDEPFVNQTVESTSPPASELQKADEKMVMSEVIKRAENALFSKTVHPIRSSEPSKLSPKNRLDTHEDELKSKSPDRPPKEVEVKREAKRKNSSIEITVATSEKNPEVPPVKVPVRERLGSKIVTNSRDRVQTQERPRTDVRERSRRTDNDRRDRSRERSRERSYRRDNITSDRNRRRDVDRRDRSRDRSPIRRRERSRSRSRNRSGRNDKVREPTKLKSSIESNNKTIERVFESAEPSPPGIHDKVLTITRTNQEENWKLSDKFVPIGFVEVTENANKSTTPPSNSMDSRKAGTPVPLAVRKQKGRINIKLSSSSKAEEAKSSSSSTDDDDEDDKDGTLKSEKHDSDSDLDKKKDDSKRKRKDKKKKTKRRRSNSSSSSSSEEEKNKKKKRAKKKKKKSKKKSK